MLIEQAFGGPKITKDGVTVAKSVELENKYENMGARLVQVEPNSRCIQHYRLTCRMSRTAPTTLLATVRHGLPLHRNCSNSIPNSATVLARAIAKEGFTVVAAGLNPHDLRRGIQLAVETVVKHLHSISKKVTEAEIQQARAPSFIRL